MQNEYCSFVHTSPVFILLRFIIIIGREKKDNVFRIKCWLKVTSVVMLQAVVTWSRKKSVEHVFELSSSL